MNKIENIRYSDKHTETLDVYLPDKSDFRTIVYFHGGGLEGGDKAKTNMAEVAERAFCVRPANDRALDPTAYAEAFRKMGIPAEGYATVAEGVKAAMEVATTERKALLCLGSLYMYGEVHEAVVGNAK